MSADHPGLAARLDAVAALMASLLSTGIALADPDLPRELRDLAADLAASGLASGGERLEVLAARLVEVARAEGAERRVAARGAHDAVQAATTWLRTWRAALSLEVARDRLGGTPPIPLPPPAHPPMGSRVVSVLGLELAGSRIHFHAADAETGEHVVLEESHPRGLELALDRAFPSRLLQADVALRTLLDATLAVGGLPASRRRGRVEIHPSFSRAAELRASRVEPPLARAHHRRLARTKIVARSGPDGWRLETADGKVLEVAVGEGLALDLVKRSADESTPALDAVLVNTSDETLLLRLEEEEGPCWPWLDPATRRWPVSRVRALGAVSGLLSADGAQVAAALDRPEVRASLAGATSGSPLVEVAERALSLPAPEGLELLEAHVALLRTRTEKGDPVPPGAVLTTLGATLAHLRGHPASGSPIATLGLPPSRLRLAAAAPIARWLAGTGSAIDAADGVLLAAASGVAADLFEL